MILVGGKGRRLQSVISDRPKPMALVEGRPFLEWLLRLLRSQGMKRITLCTGYMSEVIENHFGNGNDLQMKLTYSREHTPLGTGGAVRNALGLTVSSSVLVLNGDSYCRLDVRRMIREHLAARALTSIWAVTVDDSSRYGSVEVDETNAVRAFREKASTKQAGLINAGIYLFEHSVLEAIPGGRTVSLETDVLPSLTGKGLHAVIGSTPFIDIGIPEVYNVAGAFLKEELSWLNTQPS